MKKPEKYVIRLSGKEKQILRRLVRAGKTERREADRARIILWADKGVTLDETARRLDCHRQTALYWRKRFLEARHLGIPECLQDKPRSGRPPVYSPQQVVGVKAIACELPAKYDLPLSRFSIAEITAYAVDQGVVPEEISPTTIWRWLHQDALRPWFYRSWLFPRDPLFAEKAGIVLDLYQRIWQRQPLSDDDYVISADEKSQLQVLTRKAPTLAPQPSQIGRVEFEYERKGTLAYLAALDVFQGRIFGRIDRTVGIQPFGALVDMVMGQEPYCSSRRTFWIVDNGSSHHPSTTPARLTEAYPNIIVVHLPFHASWLNQVEIYFSILQRKALTPNDFPSPEAKAERILAFQEYYTQTATPFNWKFTRQDLERRLERMTDFGRKTYEGKV